ncbi:hypothetical protein B0H10DRAFT_2015552 [Mycena sp. CBHHK59/15]|nr:hypothetical protein B0H10DRAFT_2015552 [Mycena sp. CBHHK59/15]
MELGQRPTVCAALGSQKWGWRGVCTTLSGPSSENDCRRAQAPLGSILDESHGSHSATATYLGPRGSIAALPSSSLHCPTMSGGLAWNWVGSAQ